MNYPTLSALNSESLVQVPQGPKPSDFSNVAVLISSDKDFNNIRSNSRKPVSSKFYLSTLFKDKSNIAFAGPYIGAPYGVVLLESLIAKGASKILILGWCGSVSDKLKAGDLIIPSSAISDEGTSRNYLNYKDDFPAVHPSESLAAAMEEKLSILGIESARGRIWTTDAIYRETPEKVEFFRKKGALAVEMECSALFAAARFRNIETAALLVVSDELKPGQWVPGFRTKEFKDARKTACRVIAEFALDLMENE